jgi:SAM-dependent methyltransferase
MELTTGSRPLPKHVSRLSPALDADRDSQVIREVAPEDKMYAYAPDLYFGAGQSALRSIRLAMLAADVKKVKRVLDFGCAYGRVLRSLRAAFPEASITACDLRKNELEWCQKTFGPNDVVPVESAFEPDDVKLEGNFDLIWCGSILTHISKEQWTRFLKLFERSLAPGGVAVFTVYGRFIAHLVRSGQNLLNMSAENAAKVIRDYDETGFGFALTPSDGDTIVSRSWLCSQLDQVPSLELLGYTERAWMWQDVVSLSKTRDQDLIA